MDWGLAEQLLQISGTAVAAVDRLVQFPYSSLARRELPTISSLSPRQFC